MFFSYKEKGEILGILDSGIFDWKCRKSDKNKIVIWGGSWKVADKWAEIWYTSLIYINTILKNIVTLILHIYSSFARWYQ